MCEIRLQLLDAYIDAVSDHSTMASTLKTASEQEHRALHHVVNNAKEFAERRRATLEQHDRTHQCAWKA